MERVFICYSRKDEPFVDRLVADLKAAGVPIWRDVDDIPGHDRANTQSWRDAVQEGLRLCTHMIVVVSPDSVDSAEVKAEWNYFLRHGKPVYPVFHRDCDMPYRLFALNWWDFRRSYDQLVNLLGVLPHDKSAVRPATSPTPIQQVVVPEPELARSLILDILPAPFEWCEIPAGRVTIACSFLLKDYEHTFRVESFFMAKYQATYEQFQVFIDDPQGFSNPDWWAGLAADSDDRKAPGRQGFTHAQNLPRENVSWYDAVAFCRWLTARIRHVGAQGSDVPIAAPNWQIRLPTEWEWQWAAQGSDGREYPWGNDFDRSRCNTRESGLEKTTPVGSYPDGASPYGVLDMSGNVWEWCLNEYNNPDEVNINGNNPRVVRGGSWDDLNRRARAEFRNSGGSYYRYYYYGFRVVVGSHPDL